MARKPIQIDRDKLRAEIRKLGMEHVFYMFDDAIELLPQAKNAEAGVRTVRLQVAFFGLNLNPQSDDSRVYVKLII